MPLTHLHWSLAHQMHAISHFEPLSLLHCWCVPSCTFPVTGFDVNKCANNIQQSHGIMCPSSRPFRSLLYILLIRSSVARHSKCPSHAKESRAETYTFIFANANRKNENKFEFMAVCVCVRCCVIRAARSSVFHLLHIQITTCQIWINYGDTHSQLQCTVRSSTIRCAVHRMSYEWIVKCMEMSSANTRVHCPIKLCISKRWRERFANNFPFFIS